MKNWSKSNFDYARHIDLDREVYVVNNQGTPTDVSCFPHAYGITIGSHVNVIPQFLADGAHDMSSLVLSDSTSITAIGQYAFRDCHDLKSVTIPTTVTRIGACAFKGSLQSTNEQGVPNSYVTILGDESTKGQFLRNESSDNFEYARHIIMDREIRNCEFTNDVWTETNEVLFPNAYSITIGPDVKKLPAYFAKGANDCSIIDLTTAFSLETIGKYAFYDCDDVSSIETSGLTALGLICEHAFAELEELSDFDFSNLTSLMEIDNNAFENTAITTVDLSNSKITVIPDEAFKGDEKLNCAVFPASLTIVGNDAFEDCFHVEGNNSSVTFLGQANDLTEIKNYSQSNFEFARHITMDKAVYLYDEDDYEYEEDPVFPNAYGIKVGPYVKEIPSYLASGAKNLSSLDLEGATSLTAINKYAFNGCHDLRGVTIPATVTRIGAQAFAGSLQSKNVNNNPNSYVTILGNESTQGGFLLNESDDNFEYARYINMDREVYVVNENGSPIDESCFPNAYSITIGSHVNVIPQYLADGAQDMSSLDLSEATSLTAIGQYAFRNCEDLKGVTIPATVTRIGAYAFKGSLQSTDDGSPNSYLTILGDSSTREQAFRIESEDNFNYARHISINKNIRIYKYDKEQWVATDDDILFPNAYGISIGPDVKNIPAYFAKGANDCSSIDLSQASSLETIGKYAFYDCDDVSSIETSGLTALGLICEHAFAELEELSDFDFSNLTSLMEIDNNAFENTAINTVDLSNSKITVIPDEAFKGDEKLNCAVFPASLTVVGNDAFEDCFHVEGNNSSVTFLGQANDSTEIKNYSQNNFEFARHITMDKAVYLYDGDDYKYVEEPVFPNAYGIKVGPYVKEIPSYLASGAEDLSSLDLEEAISLERIGAYAFYECQDLRGVTFQPSVSRIGKDAFVGSLKSENKDGNPDSYVTILGNDSTKGHFLMNESEDNFEYARHIYLDREINVVDKNGLPDDESCFPNAYGVKVGPHVQMISQYLADGAEDLSSLDLSEATSLTAIGQYAFRDCKDLKGVTIPATVTRIGACAFKGSLNTKDDGVYNSYVVFSGNDSTRGLFIRNESPDNFANVRHITLNKEIHNMQYDTDRNDWVETYQIVFPNAYTISVGSDVISIPAHMAEDADDCNSLDFSNATSLNAIGDGAFADCDEFEDLDLSATKVSAIGISAFQGCDGLKSVTFPTTLTVIGENAFDFGGAVHNNIERVVFLGNEGTKNTDVTNYDGANFYNATSVTVDRNIVSSDGETLFPAAKYVTIGANVTRFTSDYFKNADNIKEVTVMWDTQAQLDSLNLSDNAKLYFDDDLVIGNINLYVPELTEPDQMYQSSNVWKEFRIIAYQPKCVGDIYFLSSVLDMKWFAVKVNGGQYSMNAMLTADIDMSDVDWTPVGMSSNATSYNGNFNGNGHILSNITVNQPTGYDNIGLFGRIGTDGRVCDLLINNASLAGTGNCGVIAGRLAGGTIENCGTFGTISFDNGEGLKGGLAGLASDGTIRSSYTTYNALYGNADSVITEENTLCATLENRANGELCFALNGNSNEDPIWGQDLSKDSIPVLNGMGLHYSRSITPDNFGTLCLPFAFKVPFGMILYSIDGIKDNRLYLIEELDGAPVAGTPYLFTSNTTSVDLYITGDHIEQTPVTDNTNGLVGTYSPLEITPDAENYVLDSNDLSEVTTSDFKCGEYHAWISLDDVALIDNASTDIFLLFGNATGISLAKPEFIKSQAYDLLGRPVNDNYRGIVIINGKKSIR